MEWSHSCLLIYVSSQLFSSACIFELSTNIGSIIQFCGRPGRVRIGDAPSQHLAPSGSSPLIVFCRNPKIPMLRGILHQILHSPRLRAILTQPVGLVSSKKLLVLSSLLLYGEPASHDFHSPLGMSSAGSGRLRGKHSDRTLGQGQMSTRELLVLGRVSIAEEP